LITTQLIILASVALWHTAYSTEPEQGETFCDVAGGTKSKCTTRCKYWFNPADSGGKWVPLGTAEDPNAGCTTDAKTSACDAKDDFCVTDPGTAAKRRVKRAPTPGGHTACIALNGCSISNMNGYTEITGPPIGDPFCETPLATAHPCADKAAKTCIFKFDQQQSKWKPTHTVATDGCSTETTTNSCNARDSVCRVAVGTLGKLPWVKNTAAAKGHDQCITTPSCSVNAMKGYPALDGGPNNGNQTNNNETGNGNRTNTNETATASAYDINNKTNVHFFVILAIFLISFFL